MRSPGSARMNSASCADAPKPATGSARNNRSRRQAR
jgi:hypothetical protein